MVLWNYSLGFTWNVSQVGNIHATSQHLKISMAALIYYCYFSIFRNADEIQTWNQKSKKNHNQSEVLIILLLVYF